MLFRSIAAAAEVTRGALYHHFADKAALFRAVIEGEAAAVAEQIERETVEAPSALQALLTGADAYFAAMAKTGRTRLLLLEGPAVLGRPAIDEIEKEAGARELREGLAAAIASGEMRPVPLDALTAVLSAAFDAAALAIASGKPADDHRAALKALIEGLLRKA